MSVKEAWKKVGNDLNEIGEDIVNSQIGKDFIKFGKHLGESVVVTVKAGVRTVSEWAREDGNREPPVNANAQANSACDYGKQAESDTVYVDPKDVTVE